MPERRRSIRADALNALRRTLHEPSEELEVTTSVRELMDLPFVLFLHLRGWPLDGISGLADLPPARVKFWVDLLGQEAQHFVEATKLYAEVFDDWGEMPFGVDAEDIDNEVTGDGEL